MFWRRFMVRRVQVIGTLLALVLGFSAHATRVALDHAATPPPAAPAPAAGFESEDHFPGAALLTAVDEDAAPGAGATGTTKLPDLPIPAAALAEADTQAPGGLDTSIHPAQPWRMGAASATDRARALQCLTSAIYYEAASEPDAGQRAVAQVILNRARHPAFPGTVCGVVYQGSEHAGCQFSFACDGSMARVPMRSAWNRALGVAADALAGQVFAPVGEATHYHTYAVTPRWNRSLVMTAAIGAHFFHRWQGWWGTPAAFSQRYAGGEPLPGPHPRVTPIAPLTLAAAAPLPVAPRPVTAPAQIQPAYAGSGTPVARPTAVVAGAEDSGDVLDRWKDSGKPLR